MSGSLLVSSLEKALRQSAKRLLIALLPGVKLTDSVPVALESAASFEVDPHALSPHFTFSKTFFLHRSVIKISRKQGVLEVEPHESFLYPEHFESLFPRLQTVLQTYLLGVSKILDHSEKTTGHSHFYLDLADGGSKFKQAMAPGANFYAFTRQKQYVGVGLIPDPYNLADLSNEVGFIRYKDKEEARAAYQERKALIFWRGSTTGALGGRDIHANQRVQFCIDALEHPGSIDAKVTNVVQFPNNKTALKALVNAGVIAPKVIETEFSQYKATIDLDGNSSSWGALRKHLRLLHVIKPVSNYEMFHNATQPRDTFTEVENLGDFFRKLQLDPNLADNFEIAWRGYRYALETRQKITTGEATIFPV